MLPIQPRWSKRLQNMEVGGRDKMLGRRNDEPLTERQIGMCKEAWVLLCGDKTRPLDVSEATKYNSETRFNQDRVVVVLGANVYSGVGGSANSRMSYLACLAHELAHWERFEAGYNRPFKDPDRLLDEAETSIRASFNPVIGNNDRLDLIEDARDRIIDWLAYKAARKEEYGN